MDQAQVQPGIELPVAFGDIDIYLFDQLLRGRFDRRPRVLDAGCGHGRNLVYLLRAGFTCYGLDRDAGAIAQVRALAARLAPALPPGHFLVGELDALPWDDACMDAVICSAVLHFASDHQHFERMVQELWRVIVPGGMLFARLASNIGLESEVGAAGRRTRLPDGSDRFLVDETILLDLTSRFDARLLDPLKTTNVQRQRCMTTWCLEKQRTATLSEPVRGVAAPD
jgi:tellurite methyltransferase